MTDQSASITASMLYDLVSCPHRVTMDLFGDPALRDSPNPFIELLWKKGALFEQEVMTGTGTPFLDLSSLRGDEKERRTIEAMQEGTDLIYGGRIQADDLLGAPDLLRKEGAGYIAGDIKSGAGEEGSEDNRKPKIHYAVQLGLYTDILERKGLSAGRHAFVWDVHGDEVPYDFNKCYGTTNPKTLWETYQETLQEAKAIADKRRETLPAYTAPCKLCHWYSVCVKQVKESDDLSMIAELGRSKRDVMQEQVTTVTEFCKANPDSFMSGKKTVFPGIGQATLKKFHDRATLLKKKQAKPYLRNPITLPNEDRELYFDIEVDPLRDVCYLHGFVERRGRDNKTEKFHYFFADEPTAESEEKAFSDAWNFMKDRQPCAIYYYSKYERTMYRKLQGKYPDVCKAEEIEELFDPANAIDLYTDIVKKWSEWPTWDHSIKTLAKFLGFSWRDTHPSGAASIEWFHKWVETQDQEIRQRILDYNEDDCRATRVLRDALETLPVFPNPK